MCRPGTFRERSIDYTSDYAAHAKVLARTKASGRCNIVQTDRDQPARSRLRIAINLLRPARQSTTSGPTITACLCGRQMGPASRRQRCRSAPIQSLAASILSGARARTDTRPSTAASPSSAGWSPDQARDDTRGKGRSCRAKVQSSPSGRRSWPLCSQSRPSSSNSSLFALRLRRSFSTAIRTCLLTNFWIMAQRRVRTSNFWRLSARS